MSLLESFGVEEAEVVNFSERNIGLHGVERSRLSWLLLVQLASALKHRSISMFSVTDVIQNLERSARLQTSAPTQFKHPPLRNFWKAHYVDARFIGTNIANETRPNKRFTEALSLVAQRINKSIEDLDWRNLLAHELTIGAFERRCARNDLTGEWLIFAKNNGKNYYLCIANHSSSTETDTEIYDAIIHYCGEEFPFIKGIGA